MCRIDRHSVVPLYYQLSELLKEEISAGLQSASLVAGDMIPSERNLMKRFGVSRNTVRKAIDELARENIIYRGQGHGNYIVVASIGIQSRIDVFCEHSRLLQKAGFQSSCNVVEYKVVSPDRKLQETLLLERDDQVVMIKKVFLADENPAILAVDYVPVGTGLFQFHGIEQSGDEFFKFLEDHGLPPVEFIRADIVPVTASWEFAAVMGCDEGTPIILLKELMLDPSQKKPVLFAENYYLPDFIHFSVMRRRHD